MKQNTDWMDKNKTFQIKEIKGFVIVGFLPKILFKMFDIECFNELKFYFNESKKVKCIENFEIKKTKKLVLVEYSSILLTKIDENVEIDNLIIECYKVNNLKWIEEKKRFFFQSYKYKIKFSVRLKKLVLYGYALKFLIRKEIKDTNIEELIVECDKERQIDWINKKENFLFKYFWNNIEIPNNLKKLTVRKYASIVLKNILNFKKKKIIIDFYEK